MRLSGKVAMITGGARGMGAAAARAFVAEGAAVAIVDRDALGARHLADELCGVGHRAMSAAADVTEDASIQGAVSEVLDAFGRVDVLYNNAGIMDLEADGPVDTCSLDAWARIVTVNLTGVFLVSRHVVPAMRRQQAGSIINTSSAVALAGASRYAAYVASKGGVAALTRSMAALHGRDGIRVNAICPGIVETDMTEGMLPTPQARASALNWHILRRLGRPEDIVGLVIYLASDESSWMTGAVIPIDGGATAK